MPTTVAPLVQQVQYDYSKFIPAIAERDVAMVLRKDKEYGASWLEYGGVGAFFVTVRKWDRIRHQLLKHGYDVFQAYADGTTTEAFADTVMDLRGYLFNWEARAIELGLVAPPKPKWQVVKTSIDTDQGQDKSEDTALLKHLIDILSPYVGERQYEEGAAAVLTRIVAERNIALKTIENNMGYSDSQRVIEGAHAVVVSTFAGAPTP